MAWFKMRIRVHRGCLVREIKYTILARLNTSVQTAVYSSDDRCGVITTEIFFRLIIPSILGRSVKSISVDAFQLLLVTQSMCHVGEKYRD